ncbi:MAG: alpha-amylase [Anaerolineae bacterium]|nr:alpha-amylase [Anaerolineae bacterium]NUQ03745.1 alpha-amylase [Anaerolineae bacterium]
MKLFESLHLRWRGKEEGFSVISTEPERPVVYQVNTWVWLNTLSRRYGETITLANVPDVEVDALARPGIDTIWLMGVWQRGPGGRESALKYKHEYRGALPDLTDDDVIGSAYAIYSYEVDERIGGREGLRALRKRLRRRGLSLLLDFVPNHVAFDHPWLDHHPEYFIQGSADDLAQRPSDFFLHTSRSGEKRVYAHGRDPLWPGWSDTAQLNIFHPALRRAILRTLIDIAKQCDGVRCDMAMLMLTDIFAGTWHGFVGEAPARDYWREMIGGVKRYYPDFVFIAEAYWGKEYDLILQGFDFAYDKVLYDRLYEGDVQKLRLHLLADTRYQRRMIRFIENHDERRAFDGLGARRSVPVATLICTLPGGVLLHDGQLTGRLIKLPVQIKRQPDEVEHRDLEGYYMRLLKEIQSPIYQRGEWRLFDIHPLSYNDITHWNLLAYGWRDDDQGCRLIVVNLTQHGSSGRIDLSAWEWLNGREWRLYDVTNGAEYLRQGGTMTSEGLVTILEPYESHVFRFEPAPSLSARNGDHRRQERIESTHRQEQSAR